MRRVRIGVSARIQYGDAARPGYLKKNLYYLEQSFARWLQSAGALVYLVPDVVERAAGALTLADYAAELDGLVLQGGSDISPQSYGEQPLRPEWAGDPERDRYELELLARFMDARKPVLGICRGQQLINVALGGTLYQDVNSQIPGTLEHRSRQAYEKNFHDIAIEPESGLARLYPDVRTARVNSIHHQSIKTLGRDLVIEAYAEPDRVIEAMRWRGRGYVFGVQWHPEFLHPSDQTVMDQTPILDEFLTAVRKHT